MEMPICHEGRTFVPSGRKVRTPLGPVTCADCRVTIPVPEPGSFTTGYAIVGPRRKVCYACAWKRERADMIREGRGVLYLTRAKREPIGFLVFGPMGQCAGWWGSGDRTGAEAEAARLNMVGQGTGYVVRADYGRALEWQVTNWTGAWSAPTLAVRVSSAFVPSVGRTRRYSVRFTGPDGLAWHGTRGESMDCIRVRRSASAKD